MPFTITSPAGLSTDSVNQEYVYYNTPDGKIAKASIVSILTPEQVQQANQQAGNALGAIGLAKQVLANQYGINVSSLPKVNPADMQQLALTKNGVDPNNGMPSYVGFELSSALANATSGAVSNDYNTDPAIQGYRNPNVGIQTQQSTPTGTTNMATPQDNAVAGNPLAKTIQPPSTNLQPGDTGAAVQQLQDYLVSKGLMTQAQVNTGYGTYGPQTTAAVQKLQEALGVDNSTGVGYFGPKTIAAVTAAPSGSQGGSGTGAGGQTSANSPELDALLNDSTLTPDQKSIIQSIYDAVTTNDTANADKLTAAMQAASQYSDPYFKAQIQLATDALSRGLSSTEGDLAFQEKQQQDTLKALRDNIAASKDYLSFGHQQELTQLARNLEENLNTTRDNLAASGFTTSTKRTRAEQLLNAENTGLVESSNKGFEYQTGVQDRNLSAAETSTAAQIANLQRLASENKLNLLRTAESQVGSNNLSNLGYSGLLGGQGGSIPRNQALDQLSFSNSFVF